MRILIFLIIIQIQEFIFNFHSILIHINLLNFIFLIET